jgi:hypothetical protein
MSFKDILENNKSDMIKIITDDDIILNKIYDELFLYSKLLKYETINVEIYELQKNNIIILFNELSKNNKYTLQKNKLNKDFMNITKKINEKIIFLENLKNNKNNLDEEINFENIKFQKLDNISIENELITNEVIIKENQEAINKIHDSIIQVNEIFIELAKLVNDQQSFIDETEKKLDVALDNTNHGLKEIKKAAEYNNRYCIII